MPDDQAACLLTANRCVCNAEPETPAIPAIATAIHRLEANQANAIRALGQRKIRALEQPAVVAPFALLLSPPPRTRDRDPAAVLHWRLAWFVMRHAEGAQ
jgi:hypothetical protein